MNEMLNNMYDEIDKVVSSAMDDIKSAQEEEIKALKSQIMEKYSDKEFVLIKRDDLRNLMFRIEDAKSYTSQA